MPVIVPQSGQGTLVAMRLRISALLAGACALVLLGSGGVGSVEAGSTASKPKVFRILSVGDIACDPTSPYIKKRGYCQHDRVGALVKRMVKRGADSFVTLGDAQYETAKYKAFRAEFHPAFRDVRSVTKAVAGNHEYYTYGARGHFRYWGKRAGTRKQPWRTYTPVAGWRVLLLDSNCERVGGCGPDSRQGRWLKRVMDGNSRSCTVAMWHHPLQTSGAYAGNADSRARALQLWKLASAGGVDVVLNGHDHIYERFAKRSGMQQFVVGTGGKNHYNITTKAPGSKKRIGDRYGVLRLDLSSDGTYKHAFVTASGQVVDRGSKTCTNEPKA
ncbi:MAG TPA: metallophosphoesterase [Actinomycetes bacterium]|nr:metallophosphoesterase [Actinomycetes bacterium]